MRPLLDAHNVQVITISTDTPAQIAKGRSKHGLDAIMLSDVELAVTDQFGLRNLGFHSGMPGGVKALPVPTTILADANGTVRWMDQSKNYQRRSDPKLVSAALELHLG